MKRNWAEEIRMNDAHLTAMKKVTENHLDEYRKYFDDALKQEGVKE